MSEKVKHLKTIATNDYAMNRSIQRNEFQTSNTLDYDFIAFVVLR